MSVPLLIDVPVGRDRVESACTTTTSMGARRPRTAAPAHRAPRRRRDDPRGRTANDKVAYMIAVLVFGHMRWMLPLGVLGVLTGGLAACPHGPNSATGTGPTPPLPPGPAASPEVGDSKIEL